MEDLKHKVEAILFSVGRKISIEELTKLCNADTDSVKNALGGLRTDYDQKEGALMVVEEGDSWKLATREKHLDLIRNIVTETELSKAVMETLAVIAFKYPILQSDLIKMRTNKAYDHIKELEESGYITRQKRGRSKLIKLTQKFFDYFDLPQEKLKEQFQDFESIAAAIEEKEKEAEKLKADQKKVAEQDKKIEEKLEKGIDDLDDDEKLGKLDVYEEGPGPLAKVEVVNENAQVGGLEIVDEAPISEDEPDLNDALDKQLKGKTKEEEEAEEEHHMKTSDGIEIKDEQQKEVEVHVEKMLHGEEAESQESVENPLPESQDDDISQDGISEEPELVSPETNGDEQPQEDTQKSSDESTEEGVDLLEVTAEENPEAQELKNKYQDKIDEEVEKMQTGESEESSDKSDNADESSEESSQNTESEPSEPEKESSEEKQY